MPVLRHSVFLQRVVLVAAVLTLGLAFPSPHRAIGNVASASQQTTGTWYRQFPRISSSPRALTCADALTCYAAGAGGSVLQSSDGGGSWGMEATGLAGGAAFSLIACGDPDHCVAIAPKTVGYSMRSLIAVTSDGGRTWRDTATLTMNSFFAESLVCPERDTCYFLADRGHSLYATADGGVTWTEHDVPLPASMASDSLSCPSMQTCYLAAYTAYTGFAAILTTTDDGASWQTHLIPPDDVRLEPSGIACPTVQTCYVGNPIAEDLLVTHNGWQTWDVLAAPDALAADAPVCPAERICYLRLGGGGIAITADGGGTWTRRAAPPEFDRGLTAGLGIACPSETRCLLLAASGDIFLTPNAATFWLETYHGTAETLTGVACGSRRDCYAVGPNGTLLATTDGATWQRLPDLLNRVDADWSGIACLSATRCVIAGSAGLATTTNGGSIWRPVVVGLPAGLSPSTPFRSVDCLRPSTCYALAGSGAVLRSTDAGVTWKSLHSPRTSLPLNDIACTSPNACVVAAGNPGDEDNYPSGRLFITRDGGKTWKHRALDHNAYFSVVCDDRGTCTAAGVSSDNAPEVERIDTAGKVPGRVLSSWKGSGFSPGTALHAVGCLTASACYAAGDGGLLVRTDNGKRWSSATLSTGDLTALTCRPGGPCYVAGADSVILSTRPSGTSAPVPTITPPAEVPPPTNTPAPVVPLPTPTTVPPGPGCPPSCSRGVLLYQSDFSAGFDGWTGPDGTPPTGWSSHDGELISPDSDGSGTTILPPFQPSAHGIENFALQFQARWQSPPIGRSMGWGVKLVQSDGKGASWGFEGGNACCPYFFDALIEAFDSAPPYGWTVLGQASQLPAPDSGWHTYRIEVDGDYLRLSADGYPLVLAYEKQHFSGTLSLEATGMELRDARIVSL